jgi:hypothetical protein
MAERSAGFRSSASTFFGIAAEATALTDGIARRPFGFD